MAESPSDTLFRLETGRRLRLPLRTQLGLLLAVTMVVLIALFTYRALQTREAAVTLVSHSNAVLQALSAVMSSLQEAETSQRGFLLTGEERYLAPYEIAKGVHPVAVQRLRREVASIPDQLRRVDVLEPLAAEKMAELERTIQQWQRGDAAGALAVVRTDRGQRVMEQIRSVITEMEGEEERLLAARQLEWQDGVTLSSRVTWGGALVLLALIAMATLLMSRDFHLRETQIWLRTGQAALSKRVQGEQRLEVLGKHVLTFLAEYLDAQVGAAYVADADGRFRRFAGYALAAGALGERVQAGDGLLGEVARTNRGLHVTDVPAGYLPVSSAVGRATPIELLLAPASVDGVVYGVVELGFFHHVRPAEQELLSRVSDVLGVAVRSSQDRSRLEDLFAQTQRQAEAMQTQQEELRVNNEELEEQSRALKESQARLESQQAELEQINAQLVEQTQRLEDQKEALTQAQAVLTAKADELERANQYKSEFLANMSHELRTPLNSSLILAKLLADNKEGNLTEEQVKFAHTISSAGNDLLVLINDILDLSKIEAGKVEVMSEPVIVSSMVEALAQSFAPLAREKSLGFETVIEPGAPPLIETDPQRLGQVLKNLLSNAIKFTEAGAVSVRVSGSPDDSIAFAVLDTGIGIADSQLGLVFEAFRQADGSTHRKYGGTGLGLSISRDLARLLGGELAVRSAPGEGSVFTLTLPRVYRGQAASVPGVEPPRTDGQGARPVAVPRDVSGLQPATVDDDRDRLVAKSRRILVVEDDVSFAAILRDLARELGFQCIVTHTAADGLLAAATYAPNAILLDVQLPDHSGLGVLDQLKQDPATRHIPVHILSVADYSHDALERGAIGYGLKPVKREQLVTAFKQLEMKFSQTLRRVLVVEDDARQRESIRQLLSSSDVQIVDAADAAEALTHLAATTFDCMVMDLTLPGLSGYELLEQMAVQDGVSFPPVIVYTGRSLTRDEEQRLRRFSKSIIIKDARSPERLLDEVTLFLHQVESTLPAERQRMLRAARDREAALEGRRVLVVEDDARNIFALSSVLEPKGITVEIARNGREALQALAQSLKGPGRPIDLVLMDIMMPEMDGLTAMREIRRQGAWKKLPIIALTAKAMRDDQEQCLAAGANDYIAKPLDVDKLLSLVRVWMPT
jgi:CheY-like chemotaxis protein/CHASE3 domain sensor protein